MSEIKIELTVRKAMDCIDSDLLKAGVEHVLATEGIEVADISLAIVDDPEIHRINREFLGHDYPTDVISFLLCDPEQETTSQDASMPAGELPLSAQENAVDFAEDSDEVELEPMATANCLQGELVVSVDTAIREAHVHGWSPRAELLLYVVHGMLHLCGYDDLTDEARPLMRTKEREILATWGFCPTGLEI